jgi:hypothetical protein
MHNRNSQLLVVYHHCLALSHTADNSAVHHPCTKYHDFPQQLPCLGYKHRHSGMVTTTPAFMQAKEYNYRGACHSNTTNINITFCINKPTPQNINFTREARKMGQLYILQML